MFQLALSSVKLVAEQVQHLAAEPVYAGRVELALRRAVPRAERLPQPLRYHVEVGGTK